MSKFVRILNRTVFPVVIVISVLSFIFVKAPQLRQRDALIKDNAEAARNLEKGKNIIQETDTAIILWDENGKVLSVSPEAARALNVEAASLEGEDISSILHTNNHNKVRNHEELDVWVQEKEGKGGLAVIRPKNSDPKEQKIRDLEDQLKKAQRPLFPPEWLPNVKP